MQLGEVQPKRGQTEVTSIVCFAFADMAAIRSLKAEIPGDHVQLVPGVDRDLEGLVVQLLGDAPAVIVVVHSPELSAARLEEVLATFSKQRERNHRLCVVEFEAGDPRAFLAGVGEAVDEMRGRGAPSPIVRPSSGPSPTRRRAPTAVDSAKVRPTLSPRSVTEPRDLVAEAPVAEAPVAEAPVTEAPVTEDEEEALEDRERASEPSMAQPPVEDPLSTTNPGPCESGTTFPDLNPSISSVRRGQAARARRKAIWRRVMVGAAAVTCLSAVAWFGGAAGLQRSAGAPSSAAAPELPTRKASRAATSPQEVPEAHSPAKPSPLPPPPAVANDAAAESRRVAAALDAKQMHALDALLIRAAWRDPESFVEARKRCARVDVASLHGWRLPSLDELRTLRRARMLPEGEYWSSARTGVASQFTLSRDVTRPRERDRNDLENVKTLCVRQR